MSESNVRTPLERCFDKLVEMLNLERMVRWFNRKFGKPPQYKLLPEGYVADYWRADFFQRLRDDDQEYIIPLEENAAGDYLATIEHAANALREYCFEPNRIILQDVDRPTPQQLERLAQNRANFGTRITMSVQDVDRWRQAQQIQEANEQPERITTARQDIEDTINSMNEELRVQGFTPVICSWEKTKAPLMDRKYPHVCFECRQPLQYEHAFGEACEKFGVYDPSMMASKEFIMNGVEKKYVFEKQFRVWWKSPCVSFLCCQCHQIAEDNPIDFMNEMEGKCSNGNLRSLR